MPSGRVLTPEKMDDPAVPRDDLATALGFIRAVNRRLGGASAAIGHLRRWTRRWPPEGPVRILDVGTGSADIPLAIVDWARRAGIEVRVVGVDLHATTLDLAREHVKGEPSIELIEADATTLMDRYEPGAFDYVHAGMFLHHLSDVRVMTVLRIMDRLARRGLIWNDLVRGVVGRIGVRLATAAAPSMVRHDARVSIDAGFTRGEALALADRVGLEHVRYRQHLWYRFSLVSTKDSDG